MPRYRYRCEKCNKEYTIQHLVAETITDCEECGATNTMKKLLSRFTTSPKTTASPKKVGQVTEEFISDAREDLKKQKRELKENT